MKTKLELEKAKEYVALMKSTIVKFTFITNLLVICLNGE